MEKGICFVMLLSVKMYNEILRTKIVDYYLLAVCNVMDLTVIFKLQSQTDLYIQGGGGKAVLEGKSLTRLQVTPSHF